jgi:multisite-specific tRNA:(cytosine-C5)-methyltransferase
VSDRFYLGLRTDQFRHALAVQKLLKTRYIPEITTIEHYDGSKVEAPTPVPWYPDELAWSMTTPKNVIRRFPPFAAFQKYLVSETSVGNISRQEVVSMIPPLVIDIEPGMVVLDMCAAPGSKAAQLLEMVHKGEEDRVRKTLKKFAKIDGRAVSPSFDEDEDMEIEVDSGDYGRTTGLLIANDSDYKRSHMLIHQLKRLSSPNLIVTNHDATMFPSIKLPPTAENPAMNRYLKFDRILADVPCSGDGTCRKNPNLWNDWNPANALGLYITQVRILVRALQMLKAGGRVVYSTCSMNPVENEAVVASAIERCGGLDKVQVIDCSDRLVGLKRAEGLRDWTVMDKGGRIFESWSQVQDEVEKNGEGVTSGKLVEGMFPQTGELAGKIPLERCMRVYAHQQDTGGFFITVLQKMTEFKAKPEMHSKKIESKPPITAIVDEIMTKPAPKEGESVAPKVEAADALTQPELTSTTEEVAPVVRQNTEAPEPEPVTGTKRERDEEVDAVVETKKLKVKEDIDEPAEAGLEDRQVHYPPPPGAELDLTTRPGDQRSDSTSQPPRLGKQGRQMHFEEPFKYISGEHEEVKGIEEFYKLSPRFPRDRFMVRNASGDPVKTIYYTSALIRDILVENEGKGIKFIHGGVKMFMRQDVQGEGVCRWRIQSEGMPILEGYVGEERVVRLYKKETLRKLLIEMFPKVTDGGWKDLGEIGERVRDIQMGCCVLRVEPSDAEDGFDERMVMPLWRSMHSLNLMLAKEDRTAMLLRIYNDNTPLVNNSKSAQQQSERQANPAVSAVAPGFKTENGEVKVDVESSAIEGEVPVEDARANVEIKPGPYGSVVQAQDDAALQGTDVKADKIAKGEETGNQEEQLNGTGGVEGQSGSV